MQSMVLPFNIIYPKYNIITPNSRITNFVSMIVSLVFMITHIFFTCTIWYEEKTSFMSYFNCMFYCFGFAMNFVIKIVQSRNYLLLVLTLQKVHTFLGNKISIDTFVIWNWILVIVALGGYALFLIIFYLLLSLPGYDVFVSFCLVVFDLNTIHATRLLKFLENKVRLWKVQVLNFQEIEHTHEGNYSKKLFQAYVDILECYNIHKVCFQEFVSILSMKCIVIYLKTIT